jgi:hypothetical protein
LTFVTAWVVIAIVAELSAVAFAFKTLAATVPLVLSAAALEGLLLAIGQSWLLRSSRLEAMATAWFAATLLGSTAGRLFEYSVDAGPFAWISLHVATQIAGAVVLGFLTGAIMAIPQALALRRHIAAPQRWIVARGLAWACALPTFLFVLSLGLFPTTLLAAAIAGIIEAGAFVMLAQPER